MKCGECENLLGPEIDPFKGGEHHEVTCRNCGNLNQWHEPEPKQTVPGQIRSGNRPCNVDCEGYNPEAVTPKP